MKVEFLERREGGSPSIERVFRAIARELEKRNIAANFTKAPFGNGVISTLRNLLTFRPSKADVFHITGHINYMGLVLPKKKTVLTIHDLTVLDFRKGFRRWFIERLYFVWPARRLRYLTAISEATKIRLIGLARIPTEKVTVIENPLLIPQSRAREFNVVKPTILQVGTAANKNVDRLIKALEGVSCTLRIVGILPESVMKQLKTSNVDFVNDRLLDDEEIIEAYNGADIVTLCSTDEGFGLPIIEAQASGVAVVTSDRSPMREVAGGGAVLVDPESVDSIRNAIVMLTNDQKMRQELIARGRENAKRYASSQIASEYQSLYSKVVFENE